MVDLALFNNQFAAGWSAPDYDGDGYSPGNCAAEFNRITQHYAACFLYSLGSDADISGGIPLTSGLDHTSTPLYWRTLASLETARPTAVCARSGAT